MVDADNLAYLTHASTPVITMTFQRRIIEYIVETKVPVTRDFLLFNRVDGLHVANYRELNTIR